MEWLSPALSFRPDGVLFPLVLTYLCQVHGFLELASRGLALRLRSHPPADVEAFLAGVDPRNVDAVRSTLSQGITGLIGQPQFASLVAEAISVDIDRLAATVFANPGPALDSLNRSASGALLIVAWDATEVYRSQEPIWEFFRHLRNASAHGGRITLRNGEPRRTAAWRDRKITTALEGKPVFAAPIATGFIGAGDVLHLLADIDALT